jgi:hypothetical protein
MRKPTTAGPTASMNSAAASEPPPMIVVCSSPEISFDCRSGDKPTFVHEYSQRRATTQSPGRAGRSGHSRVQPRAAVGQPAAARAGIPRRSFAETA